MSVVQQAHASVWRLLCRRPLTRGLATETPGPDFLSRHRERSEKDIDNLTETGWEVKIPKQPVEPGDATAAGEDMAAEEEGKKTELDGPKGPEPTRYGDWERAGRCSDF